ncbi:hypothetical protein BRC90_01155 [Halobacteriales archaeon QS_4_69_34]|nr:MAG: hypothetical protein BRC90_01155 [Halobacteriales archaeon QS_4_69_34]
MKLGRVLGDTGAGRASAWTRTALIGMFAGILFGLIIQFWMEDMAVIGTLYGARSLVRGWIAHLTHSVIGAFVFAVIVGRSPLGNYIVNQKRRAAFGLIYGLVLWIVFMEIIIPMWLDMTSVTGRTPIVGNRSRFPASFIGFLVYGLVVSTSSRLSPSTNGGHGDEA